MNWFVRASSQIIPRRVGISKDRKCTIKRAIGQATKPNWVLYSRSFESSLEALILHKIQNKFTHNPTTQHD